MARSLRRRRAHGRAPRIRGGAREGGPVGGGGGAHKRVRGVRPPPPPPPTHTHTLILRFRHTQPVNLKPNPAGAQRQHLNLEMASSRRAGPGRVPSEGLPHWGPGSPGSPARGARAHPPAGGTPQRHGRATEARPWSWRRSMVSSMMSPRGPCLGRHPTSRPRQSSKTRRKPAKRAAASRVFMALPWKTTSRSRRISVLMRTTSLVLIKLLSLPLTVPWSDC